DVHVHITNYQDRYYGGSAMIRLYRFDLARQTIDVSTFSPYFTGVPEDHRTELQRLEVELTSAANRFSVPLNVPDPTPAPPPRPARSVLVPGTLAYWRFDGQPAGAPVATVRDQSGHGNDLTRVTVGRGPAAPRWSAQHRRGPPRPARPPF